jgi:16S rRNA (guanine527-N7)-methyltransferase
VTEDESRGRELLSGDVSRETLERLSRYAESLTAWNRRINLISAADMDLLWARHIVDCAQIAALVPAGATWLDIGSGGGFPGIVVAAIVSGTGSHVHLVESNRKKAAFLARIAADLGLPATVHARRIESLRGALDNVTVVTARAVAPLPRLLELAEPWLTGGARSLFQKGRDYRAELEQCRDGWIFDLVEHRSRTDGDAVILEISGLRRRKRAPEGGRNAGRTVARK